MRVSYSYVGSVNHLCKLRRCFRTNNTDLVVVLGNRMHPSRIELCSAHHAQLRRLLMQALLRAEI